MIPPFVYAPLPARVVFGWATLDTLGAEIDRLGARRALVLSTPQQEHEAELIAERLGIRAAGVFAGAVMHTPMAVSDAAAERARSLGADVTIAVGGGSTIGLGKAIALRTGIDQIAVPTTYAGSEMTPILGQTRDGLKTTVRSLDVLPEVVLYDVSLTLSLPAMLTATSGMNAVAHAVEALYAEDRNPVVSLMAEDALRALAHALPALAAHPADRLAREEALYGAFLAGACLGSVGMGLHHKLCHVLGGSFGLPHAETHAVVLPHVAAFNALGAADALARVGAALGAERPGQALYDLAHGIGAPTRLADIGMRAKDLDPAADLAIENAYYNPRPVTRAAIRALIEDAFHGRRPEG